MRSSIAIFFVFLFVGLTSTVRADYRFDIWTTDNGLPQNGVREITQTPEGYLWFTTFDGLVRFDGVTFTTFNKGNTPGITNNRFTGIFVDTDGTLYATTREDGILTIYKDGVFTTMDSGQVPGLFIGRMETGPDGKVRFLVDEDDRKTKSWYRLVDGAFEFIEVQEQSAAVPQLTGSSGTRWTVGENEVIAERDGVATRTPLDLTKYSYTPHLFEDRDGSLWIGENAVHRVRNGKLTTFSEKEGLPANSVYHHFWQEDDGGVWVSSGGGSSTGVGLIEFTGDTHHIWGKDHGLGNTNIQDVYHDREGSVWLATGRGLARRRQQLIDTYSTADGINFSEVYPMLRDSKGTVWIGTARGISTYRDGKFQEVVFPAPPGTPIEDTWRRDRLSVQALYEDPNGRLWIGVNGGLFLKDGETASMIYRGPHVTAIKGDRDGNVWAVSNQGLFRFRDYALNGRFSRAEGLPHEFMTFVMEDSQGTLWFGGHGGLTRYENGQFRNYTKADGLSGNYVRTIYEDKEGAFWIGTYDEGLTRFKDGRFVNYREENGLYSNGVFAIEEDAAGNFWISSNRGIYRVNRHELNAFADRRVDRINSVGYGKGDGMLSNECNGGRQPASLRDEEGRFWFPTQDGIAIVDPNRDRPNLTDPTVVIEDLLVERTETDFRRGAQIAAGRKDFEIKYTGISLIKSDQIKFQYKLEGHDAGWVDAGSRRTAHYSYLPPGSYVFRVRAANSDGVWSTKDAAIGLELQPFFYQTRPFALLCIGAFAVVLMIIWKISVHQFAARERRLKLLVAERTAELAKANEELRALANSDGLTRIGNRRRFESFLADEWHRAVRFKTSISLVMFDIDHFKRFNDAYGHQAGDECLQKVAEAFAATIHRPTDLVARFGGEEFAMILGGTDAAGALQLAEEAVANLRAMAIPHSASPTDEYLTVSVGIATVMANFELSEGDLIKLADSALYRAKHEGRDRIYTCDRVAGVRADPLLSDVILAG